MESSKIRPRSWTLSAIKRLSRLDDIQNFDLYLERQGSITWLSRLDEFFRILASILNVEVDEPGSTHFWSWTLMTNERRQMGSMVFSVSSSVFEYRGQWAWFHPFDLSSLSHCFIWTSIISSGAVVTTGWLEVITSSQISSSRPFRLACMRVMNCFVQLIWIRI